MGKIELLETEATNLNKHLNGLFRSKYEIFLLDQSVNATTKIIVRDENCDKNFK